MLKIIKVIEFECLLLWVFCSACMSSLFIGFEFHPASEHCSVANLKVANFGHLAIFPNSLPHLDAIKLARNQFFLAKNCQCPWFWAKLSWQHWNVEFQHISCFIQFLNLSSSLEMSFPSFGPNIFLFKAILMGDWHHSFFHSNFTIIEDQFTFSLIHSFC